MNLADQPAAGTHLFYLDDAGVLFSETAQELHLLNTTATAIWSLLEEGHDARTVAIELQRMFQLDAVSSAQFVATALTEWRDRNLLAGFRPAVPGKSPASTAAGGDADLPVWRDGPVFEERHYRLLSSVLRIRYSTEAQMRMVHPVIGHLELSDSSSQAIVVDIIDIAGRLVVYRDRQPFLGCTDVTGLAPIVKSVLWVNAVNNHHYFLNIHAGVVGDGSRCVLFPARPGSGKSTLTASLVHAGFEFFSDEVALLEEGSLNVIPVPLAICVKSTGIEALADRFPILRELQVHQRSDGKLVTYMPPPPGCRPVGDHARPIAALVFPRYVHDAATSLATLAPGAALKCLLDECMAVRMRLDVDRIGALVDWISRIPCHELTYGSTEEAIMAVRSVFALGTRASHPGN